MIIITGASKGIGKYLAKEFAKSGEQVLGFFLNSEVENQQNLKYFKIDTTNYNQVATWVSENRSDLNQITLINCAGKNYNAFAHKADINKWVDVINVNLIGTFNLIHSVLPIMREQGFGRIINFGSVVAQVPSPGVSSYSASKSALWGLASSLAAENASKGITVNNINLGYSELGMIQEVPQEYLNVIMNRIPSGKLCTPQDILNTVQFLRDTSYLNGTNINLNGGLI